MKLLKKILRIIAILLPCICCLFLNNNSYADSYEIDSFFAHGLYYFDNFIGQNPEIVLLPGVTSRDNFNPRSFANLRYNYDLNSQRCRYNNSYSQGLVVSNDVVTFGGAFYLDDFLPTGNAVCRVFNGEFGVNMPIAIAPDIPDPYYSSTVSILPKDSRFNITPFTGVRVRDGINYTGRLSLMSYLNNYFGSAEDSSDVDNDNSNDRVWVSSAVDVRSFSFPINFIADESISSVNLTGSISFKPNDSQVSNYGSIGFLTTDFISHGVIRIRSNYVYYDSNNVLRYYSQISPCVWSYSNTLLSLNYSCQIIHTYSSLPHGVVYHLEFNFDDSDIHHLFNSEDVIFNNIFITTNGITSDLKNGSYSDNGATPNVAPGMPDIEDSYGNWSDSFINAINFTFSNPFTPLFNMFLPPNECANIPIIASMIHSNQTRICPIYPQSVYPITTPVFTFIGIMLLFSFLVRWLHGDSFIYVRGVN